MHDEVWLNKLIQLQETVKGSLYSPLDFTTRLKELFEDTHSPFEAFEISCKTEKTEEYYSSGRLGSVVAQTTKRRDFNVGAGKDLIECSFDYLEKRGSNVSNPVYDAIGRVIDAYLQPDARVKGFGVLDAQTSTIKECLQPTLVRMTSDLAEGQVFVVYIDLDGFKLINDKLSHSHGDDALRHVAACIRTLGASNDIVGLRKGGDEFALIARGFTVATLVTSLETLHQSVAGRLFGDQFQVGFTAGAVRVNLDELATRDFDGWLSLAEEVTKESGTKEKKRGTVSISQGYVAAAAQLTPVDFAMLQIALLRTRLLSSRPFGNELLNVVSHIASDMSPDAQMAEEGLDALAKRLALKFGNFHFSDLVCGRDLATCNVPAVAFALAIAHGRLKALTLAASDAGVDMGSTPLSVKFSENGQAASLFENGAKVWEAGGNGQIELAIGTPIRYSSDRPVPERFPGCLAVQIGLKELATASDGSAIPQDMFSDVVVVDDRPKTGGGLPDFWQAAISHVVSALCKQPSVKQLVVLGQDSNAPKTVEKLRSKEQWSEPEEIALLTNFKTEDVRRVAQGFADSNRISFIDGSKNLIEIVYRASVAISVWDPSCIERVAVEGVPHLERELRAEKFKLSLTHGLTCHSAAQAYPLVVEVVRNADVSHLVHDDAGQEMNELTGFKLMLTDVAAREIPDYWIAEEDDFRRYAEAVLLKSDSFIGSELHHNGQYEHFIKHLSTYCVGDEPHRSTRRAILVVPNKLADGQPKPLGLVCVWATPKILNGRCEVEFSFVWRTVETLVGFPYSLYGSIALAARIVKDLGQHLYPDDKSAGGLPIMTGKLTYTALSLHMRMDEFHRKIAKRIVDAASR